MVTINKTFILNLKRPQGKPEEYFDEAEKGFGIRIGKKGQVKFLIDYTINEYDLTKGTIREKRFRKVFGTWSKDQTSSHLNIFTIDDARKRARSMLDLAREDKDPFKKTKAIKSDVKTFGDLLLEHRTRHIAKNCSAKTQENYDYQIKTVIMPALGHIDLNHITHSILEKFHAEVGEKKTLAGYQHRHAGGHITANRALTLIKCALNNAVQWGYLDHNPASKIKPFKESPRMRYLSAEEVSRILSAGDELINDKTNGHRYADCVDAIKMSLMTGCRKGELLRAKWEDINLNSTPPTWSKPQTTTKQNEWEHIPLAPDCAMLLLRRQAENDARDTKSIFVFPAHNDMTTPLLDLKRSWETIRKRAGLKDCRFHDLRHTFASHMAIQGKSLYVIGKMLGHKNAQTTQRYAKLNTGALEDLANSMSAVVQAAIQVPVKQADPANDNNDPLKPIEKN